MSHRGQSGGRQPATKFAQLVKKLNRNRYRARPATSKRDLKRA